MKKRLILLAGVGVGFVLGSRAGRQSYEKLKAQVEEWWQDPRVQDSVTKATDTVKEQAPIVADRVKEKAPEVAGKVQSAAGSAVGAVQHKVDDVKTNREQKKAEKSAAAGADDLDAKKDAEAKAAAATPAAGSVADPSAQAQQDTGVEAGSKAAAGGSVTEPSSKATGTSGGAGKASASGKTAGTSSDAVILDDSISDPSTPLEAEGPTTGASN
ncbi:hypothetical protein AB0I45_12695 [Brevibacterium sp. NPDC049920]|uniref:hypothetical protein n=1 Tax=Brevibacterium sp. NPDC049920 TaxID=3155279 RepID=UPI0033D6F323